MSSIKTTFIVLVSILFINSAYFQTESGYTYHYQNTLTGASVLLTLIRAKFRPLFATNYPLTRKRLPRFIENSGVLTICLMRC